MTDDHGCDYGYGLVFVFDSVLAYLAPTAAFVCVCVCLYMNYFFSLCFGV